MASGNNQQDNNNNNMQQQSQVGQSILDVILEKTTNIEATSNKTVIKRILNEQIKTNGKREQQLRYSTVTIAINEEKGATKEQITDEIETKWMAARERLPCTFWQDRESVYCQFTSSEEKSDFLDHVRTLRRTDENFAKSTLNNICKPDAEGLHFVRKPVRVIINNVKANVKLELIEQSLKRMMDPVGAKIEDLKEGKVTSVGNMPKVRNVMFRIDSRGFRVLFKGHDGAIPYSNPIANTRIKLIARVNARPFQCRECMQLGQHQCKGKACGQCGQTGHMAKECRNKTKFCANCKQKGHRAKDTHCPTYLMEMSRELRRMDVPLEFLTETEYREMLIRHLQLK